MADAPSRDFRLFLKSLTDPGGVFFALGQTDVGKSTLLQNLVRRVTARGERVVVLDADVGQSTYGLPTTLNLVAFSPKRELPVPEPIACVFIGATSPVGHLLPVTVGCRRLLDRAHQLNPHAILIDSTGLVEGPLALEFKLQKFDLLRPAHIIALARGRELDPILQACRQRTDITIHLLPVAAAVRVRSAAERRATRQRKYREYFSSAIRHQFQFPLVSVWGPMPQQIHRDLSGLLVGLNNAEGFCLGVGLLHNISTRGVEVSTPLANPEAVRLLRFGTVALDAHWQERFFSPRHW